MGLSSVFILAGILLLLRLLPKREWRHCGMIICSVWALFLFQPLIPIRGFDFWLPLAGIGLCALTWGIIAPADAPGSPENRRDILVCCGAVLLLSCTRFLNASVRFTPSRPPQILPVLAVLLGWGLLTFGSVVWCRKGGRRAAATLGIAFLILLLLFLKTPALSRILSAGLRRLSGQSTSLAAASDLRWFGFSYIAFRLLSLLIEGGKGRKFDLTFGEVLIYVCFPAALAAGPIDRADRFVKAFRQAPSKPFAEDFENGAARLARGLFRKFILADTLARFSFSAGNAGQFIHKGGAWVALIAYTLQLYFDFAGYSDLAVGLGTLFGISLPENFNHPYRQPDLTKFWSNWHMSLTQWIRTYVFNPLTRQLRSKKEHALPQWTQSLITQLTTMLLIGLWHGVGVNFIIWGAWHGFGLFVHQLYNRRTASALRKWGEAHPVGMKAYTVCSTLLTLLYVCLGWVWFVTPAPAAALSFFGRLFG